MAAVAPAAPAASAPAATAQTNDGTSPGDPYNWDLIPADKIVAFYSHKKRPTLTLHAKGTILVQNTYGVEFRRKPFFPVPAFDLGAWYPHWRLPGDAPYTHKQTFNIRLPPNVKFIPVWTLPTRKPRAVPVIYLESATEEEKADPFSVSTLTDALPTSALLPAGIEEDNSASATLDNDLQLAIVGVPFDVSVSKDNTSYIHWDHSKLKLENARVSGGKIVWTFVADRVGGTEIIIDQFSPWGIPSKTVINVTIVGDDSPTTTQ